jgi:hypothetical protein
VRNRTRAARRSRPLRSAHPGRRLALLIEQDPQVRERIAALQAEQAHLQEKINWCRGQIGDDER